jgi:hypothetical protein
MLRTPNGTAVRTGTGWVWLCRHCSVTAQLGMAEDLPGFDPQQWVDSVDASHLCWHKCKAEA